MCTLTLFISVRSTERGGGGYAPPSGFEGERVRAWQALSLSQTISSDALLLQRRRPVSASCAHMPYGVMLTKPIVRSMMVNEVRHGSEHTVDDKASHRVT